MIHWGCIGTGAIASAMAEQLSMHPQAIMSAICPATGRRIDADQLYGFQRVVANYEELISLPEIDIVYVASANTDHARHSLAALRAGKHVLCEKPVAMNNDELKTVLAVARMYKRLFLDGIFQAYLPSFRTLMRELKVRSPTRIMQLNEKIKHEVMQNSHLLTSPSLGGGIYEGTGSYTAHMLVSLMGVNAITALHPHNVVVSSTKGQGDVDWETIVTIDFPSGSKAVLTHVAQNDTTPSKVASHSGNITFDLPKISYIQVDGKLLDIEGQGRHPGLGWEVSHAMELLTLGAIESPLLPHDVSLATGHLMDIVRSKMS